AWVAAGLAVLAGGSVLVATGVSGAAPTARAPRFDPANFDAPRANPYFPLTPGLVLRYRGTDDGAKFRERVTVTHKTKMVDGVRATVLHDVLRRADGTVAEATHDWYADDDSGNVWYLGEATATYKHN